MTQHVKVVWYREEDDKSWKKCWREDSERLERLHCTLRDATEVDIRKLRDKQFLLENTRLSANVMERRVVDTYMEHPTPRRLVRGTWFYG